MKRFLEIIKDLGGDDLSYIMRALVDYQTNKTAYFGLLNEMIGDKDYLKALCELAVIHFYNKEDAKYE